MTGKNEYARMMFSGQGIKENDLKVQELHIALMNDFHTGEYGHIFEIKDDKDMKELVESIKEDGQLEPIIVRLDKDETYEIISGHRRVYALAKCGVQDAKAIVIDADDEEAIKLMVASNLMKRKNVPIMTQAIAIKAYITANKRQGKRNDLTLSQSDTKLDTMKNVSEIFSVSRATAARMSRLTELIPELQDMVDDKTMPVGVGIELSYLTPAEQLAVYTDVDSYKTHMPSINTANELHIESVRRQKEKKEQMLDEEIISKLKPEKKLPKLVLNEKYLTPFLPVELEKASTEEKARFVVNAINEYIRKLS